MARPWVAKGQIRRVAVNSRISSRGQPTRGGSTAWGLGEGLTSLLRKKKKESLLRNVTQVPGTGNLVFHTKEKTEFEGI
jgi:hypothetical protein